MREVWIGGPDNEADAFVDISSVFDRKMNAPSRLMSDLQGIDKSDFSWLTQWMKETGAKADPPLEFAEAFKVMRINGDEG